MKLATYKDGSRDGQLVVVSRDLTTAHYATGIASRLQQALDDWNFFSPQLQDLYETLNGGKARHAFAFDPAQCMAPLPRAYQWLSGTAYPNHVELVHAAAAQDFCAMTQGGSDDFLGPCDDIRVADEAFGIDFAAALAAVTGDVPLAATPEQGLDAVRLLALVNDISLRELMAEETSRHSGPLQGKPPAAFGPVAVTPDELGDAWRQGRVYLSMQTAWNGRKVGLCDAGPEMRFHFGELIAHAARTRRLRAGAMVGGGPVSNTGSEREGQREWPKGYACIAEKRAMEILRDGAPKTGYMRFGDTIRIEMKGRDGESVFGAIDQKVHVPSSVQHPS
ncbi:MAG: fumarylacetoacetate hydrolase family protein [Burkholderiaceae bacterium]|jgi:fumarylacetoacetate (FAA) hydrolase|nr:fumarylacetoacetate hydrolase family protein [Burkholderiaceae bacterium]